MLESLEIAKYFLFYGHFYDNAEKDFCKWPPWQTLLASSQKSFLLQFAKQYFV